MGGGGHGGENGEALTKGEVGMMGAGDVVAGEEHDSSMTMINPLTLRPDTIDKMAATEYKLFTVYPTPGADIISHTAITPCYASYSSTRVLVA